MKNHTDVLIVSQLEQVQVQICAGASQICLMARELVRVTQYLRFASPRRVKRSGMEISMFGVAGAVGLLAAGGIFDIKSKKIPMIVLGVGGIWSVVGLLFKAIETGIPEALFFALTAIIPGAVLVVLSFLTEKKIGYGDGIILMILGCMEGAETAFLVCCIGLFLQSLFAVGLLIAKRADKQSCIPFVPFLFAARIVLLFVA